MDHYEVEPTQDQINRLCRAASAVYFSIVRSHATRTGTPAMIPELLSPISHIPSVHEFDLQTLDEAEQFLMRLGVITEH